MTKVKATMTLGITLALTTLLNANLAKEWSRNSWDGYKPFATHEFQDGVLHIYNVQSEHGFGWNNRKRYDAVSGDEVVITAQIKGEGEIAFQLFNYAADGTWFGIDPKKDSAVLGNDWQQKTFRLQVSNLKKGVTGKISPAFTGKKDAELHIKDIAVEVVGGSFVGDLIFPRHWHVFGDVDSTFEPVLNAIPAKIDGKKGKQITLNGESFSLKPFFAKPQHRNCAWLYAEIEAPYASDYTIGAGADYYMALYVNGVKVIDTIESGNGDFPPHFSNHKANVGMVKGTNIIAMKFLSGGNPNPCVSLGGANELRNLSSVVTVTRKDYQDDYENPGLRSGNPKLIEGILTDGIEEKCGLGLYSPGSKISFAKKTHQLPAKSGEYLFATGIRLHKLAGNGTMSFEQGGNVSLVLTHNSLEPDVTVDFTQNGKVLRSMAFPKRAFPADIVLAISHNAFFVNALSIQDSKLRAMNGEGDFSELKDFLSFIRLEGCEATVDNYFIGLGKREVKSTTIPFKIALDQTFDPVKAGWEQIWQDEFDGEKVDWENTWMNSPWNPVPKNRDQAYLKDGFLHIRCDFKKNPEDKDGKFPFKGRTVGLYSQKRFSYGYYEARVRFTKKPGWWAAFWMFDEGRNMSLGGGYELDIFEDYSTRGGAPIIANNLHVTYGPNMRSYGYHFELPGSMDDFYVIGCKWTPFEFSTYLNGKLVRTNARHSPYGSATYDAFNHAFGTSTLYFCLSGQAGRSGGPATGEYSEEFIVDYARAYEYPRENDPLIKFTETPDKSVVKTGEPFVFEVAASPSEITGSPLSTVYLFDNGNLLDYKTEPPFRFSWSIDPKQYENTAWDNAGRSGKKPVMDGYPHFFIVAVQDEAGNVAYTEAFPMMTDMTGGQPYKETILSVPGTVSAVNFNTGGQNVSYYKQVRGGIYPTGQENLFSRGAMHLREAGEWVAYTVNVQEAGTYKVVLNRREYRREWPMRGMLIVDGQYVGDLESEPEAESATLNVDLKPGKQLITLISACTYGVWPESIEFIKE